MTGPIAVFAGPSLPPADRPDDPELLWLPPVARGDVARLVGSRRRPRAIALVDGYFEGRPAVLHKEILWALAEGIPVSGAASMGALRAAELQPFGMIGIGRIFAWFRDGVLTDDDEVAVRHGPAELGWPTVTLAMVDLRASAEAGLRAGILDAATTDTLIAAGKRIFYRERDWPAVLAAARRDGAAAERLAAFAEALPAIEVPQKRLDALALLDVLRGGGAVADPPPAPADFGWTEIFARLAGPPGDPRGEPVDADPLLRLVLDEIRLDPRRLASIAPRARLVARAGRPAPTARRPRPTLLDRLGFARRGELAAWARTHGLDEAGLVGLATHAARLAALEQQVDDRFLQALLDEIVLAGLWPAAAARARRKLALGDEPPEEAGSGAALRLWYFEVLLREELPEDLEGAARLRGFRDLADFTRALRYEWRYRHDGPEMPGTGR